MTAYVPFGPFQDNSAPGLSAALFNGLEQFLITINPGAVNTPLVPTVIPTIDTSSNGSGSVTMWCFFGNSSSIANSYKLYLFYFSAYRNSTATRQRITLPVPFTTGGIAQVGGIVVPTASRGIYTIDNTTGGHNWNAFTAFNTASSQGTLPCYSIGEFNNEMSFMDIDGSGTGNASGWVRIEGV